MVRRKSATFCRAIFVIVGMILAACLLPASALAADDTDGAPGGTPAGSGQDAKAAPEGCIAFTSDKPFTVSLGPGKHWDGKVEYSLDGENWSEYAAGTKIESGDGCVVYFRGTGNTWLSEGTLSSQASTFSLAPSGGHAVSCSGNAEALLDYEAVLDGGHPSMGMNAFSYLFYDCTSLASAPALPATALAICCYDSMFYGCTSLASAPTLPATTLADSCYYAMFSGCTSLTTAPALPAEALAGYCYADMFYNCTSLDEAPELPANTLARDCYDSMFWGCTALASAPELPATTLAEYCYGNMFRGCTSLASAPELPATALAVNCYMSMFSGCTSLASAPALPATTLAGGCYESMFDGCESLDSAPELPATTLAGYCYMSMFSGCTSLDSAPALPATTLADYCYAIMFRGCTSLDSAPALPATTLAGYCYADMFSGCTALDSAPALPATTLAGQCYNGMFEGSGVKLSEEPGTFDGVFYGTPYRIPSEGTGTGADGSLTDMFKGTGGPFTGGTPAIDKTYYLPGAPEGCIAFTSDEPFEVSLGPDKHWDGTVEYSLDGVNWSNYTADTSVGSGGRAVFFRGTGNTRLSEVDDVFRHSTFSLAPSEGHTVSCLGNAETLLDYQTVQRGEHPDMGEYAFYKLFYGCMPLVSAPQLPATELAGGCYREMFCGCTVLKEAPELPAEALADSCYRNMFWGCTSLASAPALPATGLAKSCYQDMFSRCTSLTEAPALPAEALAGNCYMSMFYGCTALTEAPALPAEALAGNCYREMFRGCTSLTSAPELPAEGLVAGCYASMFENSGVKLSEKPGTFEGVFYGTPYRIPSEGTGTGADGSLTDMFKGTGGPFTGGTPAIDKTYYLPGAPEDCILFTSDAPFAASLGPQQHWDGTIEYSLDGGTWSEYTAGAQIESGDGCAVFFRGTGNKKLSEGESIFQCSTFSLEPAGGHAVSCSGNAEALLDYEAVQAGGHPEMGMNAFSYLFYDCTSLEEAPELPATTLATSCYQEMFHGCTSLASAPALPATTLATSCYQEMFYGCTSLEEAPELPATTLASSCYYGMFYDCTSLEEAPELPAEALAFRCYGDMFSGCTSLTEAPELPATGLADYCYQSMFYGCTSLVSAPELPATTLAFRCYYGMFSGCTSLEEAPELPATTLAFRCYGDMFYDCTSLASAPELPATTLAAGCYHGMFSGCTALTEAPALPAEGLAEDCYDIMFYGCTALATAPALPAATLAPDCYRGMFEGSGVKLSDKPGVFAGVPYGTPYRIPSGGEGAGADGALTDMFSGTTGPFEGTPDINKDYYLPGLIRIDAPVGKTLPYTGAEQAGVEPGEGYALTGEKATAAGDHTATATPLDGYAWSDGTAGAKEVPWEITPADISEATVSAADQVYDGTGLEPAPTVAWKGTTLKPGADYTVTYRDNTGAGTASVAVEGKGNFEGEATATFEIAKRKATIAVASASKVAGEADPAFTGKVEGLAKAGDLGEVSYVREGSDEEPGTYAGVLTAVYTANPNYEVAVVPGDFTIEPAAVDRSALEEGAAACAAALASAIVSADGSDVDPADRWVTQGDVDALEAAIAAARTVLSDGGATQAQVDAATAQLAAALGRFEASKQPGAKPAPEPEPQVWERIAGKTALDTMSAVVDAGGFEPGGTVVLASLEGYWDALAAAGIAGLEGAPVLMVPEGFLGAQAAAQLAKLAPAKIIACGGTDWIPALTIEQAVAAAGTGPEVVRLAGEVAVGTAEEIAKAGAGRWSGTAIVATVGTFQDALAAAPLSYAKAMPVYFAGYDPAAETGSLAQSTIDSMKASGITRAYVAGGEYWLPESIEDQLEAAGIQVVKRLAGGTAVETSAAIAEEATSALGMTADGMGVADISRHYDALASAAFCGKASTVLALALDERSSVIGGFVKSHAADISRGYVFGGSASVSDATLAALEAATRGGQGQ